MQIKNVVNNMITCFAEDVNAHLVSSEFCFGVLPNGYRDILRYIQVIFRFNTFSETFIPLSRLLVNRINLETDSRSKHRLSSFGKSSLSVSRDSDCIRTDRTSVGANLKI